MDFNTRIIVTGCAGFIGSNLVDRLISSGFQVVGIDNLSTGKVRFLDNALSYNNFHFIEADLLDLTGLKRLFSGGGLVFHFAANADVRFGVEDPSKDLKQGTIATFNVLEAMRENGIKQIVFSSTGSVYGEAKVIPTSEESSFPVQTSLYGASKLACEGLIQAYSEGFEFQSWIFRFVSILGNRYTHGHVFDFYKQLKSHPGRLMVLGDGRQRKSYLYIQDCIDAMLIALDNPYGKINIFNLGVDDFCEVNDSIHWISEKMCVQPIIKYSGGSRGWVGDNPFIFLDTKKIRSLGWNHKFNIRDGIIKTVEYLEANEWVFELT